VITPEPTEEAKLDLRDAKKVPLNSDIKKLQQAPAYYLIPPSHNFPTVDAVVLMNQQVYLLKMTTASMHSITPKELEMVEKMLPKWISRSGKWHFCFVGDDLDLLRELITSTATMTLGPKWQPRLSFAYIHQSLQPNPNTLGIKRQRTV